MDTLTIHRSAHTYTSEYVIRVAGNSTHELGGGRALLAKTPTKYYPVG